MSKASPRSPATKIADNEPLVGYAPPPANAPVRKINNDGTWIEDNDCYFYKFNKAIKFYSCEYEKELLRRGLYQKRELDYFLYALSSEEESKPGKSIPTAMLAFATLFCFAALIFFILAWREKKNGWEVTFYTFMGIAIGLGVILLLCSCFLIFLRHESKNYRKKRILHNLSAENNRILHRGLNWKYTPEYLELRANYWIPFANPYPAGPVSSERTVTHVKTMEVAGGQNRRVQESSSVSSGRYSNSRLL